MLAYVRLYKIGMCKFPSAIKLLNKVRQDRITHQADLEFIQKQSHDKMSKMHGAVTSALAGLCLLATQDEEEEEKKKDKK